MEDAITYEAWVREGSGIANPWLFPKFSEHSSCSPLDRKGTGQQLGQEMASVTLKKSLYCSVPPGAYRQERRHRKKFKVPTSSKINNPPGGHFGTVSYVSTFHE